METMKVCDVVVTHPCIPGFLRGAAVRNGHATAVREGQKRAAYRGLTAGYDFVPLAHQSYGRLGCPATALINELAGLASASGTVSKTAFVVTAYRKLSVAVVKGNSACFSQLAFN